MYDPPSLKNWVYKHYYSNSYKIAYDRGYIAAQNKLKLQDNPYKESFHERETTFNDELNYWWYVGWCDFNED